MSRTSGTYSLSANIETLAAAPLDARMTVPAESDLVVAANFPYPYVGMPVVVKATGDMWILTAEPTTSISNWRKVGSGSITVDDEISRTSENPVQNKVIKGALDEKADLVNGKVPSSQLPAYVDDVLEGYYNETDGKFYEDSAYTTEIVGESGKIYISVDTNYEYRWSGSIFVRINGGVELGETSDTAYRGDRGKAAYDDSQSNKSNIGDLSHLYTEAKSDLVSAINEISSITSIQVETLPTPSAELAGKVYEYVGETTSNYTHGLFYECVQEPEEIVDNSYVLPVQTTAGKDWFTIVIDFDQTVTTTRGVCKYRINGTEYNNTQSYAPLNLDVHEGDVLDFMTYSSGTTSLVCWKSLNTPIYWAVTNVDGTANIQVSTLPTASEKLVDKIYQYVGESGVYVNGYFYKCVPHTGIVEHTLLVNDTNKSTPFQLKANVAQTVTFTKGANFNVMYYYLNGVESPASGYHQRDALVSVPVQIGDELKGTFNQNSATECTIRYKAEETHYQWEIISMEGTTISQVDFNALPQEAKNNGDVYYIYDSTSTSQNTQTVTGYTPIGTIISVMGNSAPLHYLACDGSTVNIADYPELAAYFEQQFGEINHFGGDGETTFAVPDLRGEFLRGTGTNSHTNQGSGANVGIHQDATVNVATPLALSKSSGTNILLAPINESFISGGSDATYDYYKEANVDKTWGRTRQVSFNASKTDTLSDNWSGQYTSRPTNTSVLYCIATKNIYINPENIYSTNETVVGQWIDGKPIYQKTFQFNSVSTGEDIKYVYAPNADVIVDYNFMMYYRDGRYLTCVGLPNNPSGNQSSSSWYTNGVRLLTDSAGEGYITVYTKITLWSVATGWTGALTIRYTKTTD